MRIISGKYKGRKIKGFDIEGTRPTMDRVKESIFGMIQDYIKDSIVLDLFAGSGSLGLEAISNGASKLYLCDNNSVVIDILKENVKFFDEDIDIIKTDYKRFLKNTNVKFDVIFLDPPYKSSSLNKAIKIIEERNLLNSGGILVCEYEGLLLECSYFKIKEKNYGLKTVSVFKK